MPSEGMRRSAVLVPLCWINGRAHLLLTKRSMNVEIHKGEISFPGGGVENIDKDEVATALREAWEEINLFPSDVRVIGFLDDYMTILGFHITPVVGVVPYPYDFNINRESESIIYLPFEYALRDDTWMTQEHSFGGRKMDVLYLNSDGGVIWGATARMLKLLADLVSGRPIPAGPLTKEAREWVENIVASQSS